MTQFEELCRFLEEQEIHVFPQSDSEIGVSASPHSYHLLTPVLLNEIKRHTPAFLDRLLNRPPYPFDALPGTASEPDEWLPDFSDTEQEQRAVFHALLGDIPIDL